MRRGADDPVPFEHGELGGPIGAEAHAVDQNAGVVDLGSREQIVERAAEHPLGGGADLEGRLTGSRTVHGEIAHPMFEKLIVGLGDGFLPAVESADREHDRHRPSCVLRQAQIADDLLAFEGDRDPFEWRVQQGRVPQIGVDSHVIGALLAVGVRDRPLPEIEQPPRLDQKPIGLGTRCRLSRALEIGLCDRTDAAAHSSRSRVRSWSNASCRSDGSSPIMG